MRKILLFLLVLSVSYTFGQDNVTLLGKFTYTNDLSDIWGYVDDDGNEYALVGTISGLSIVDVTNPDSLAEVHFEPGVTSVWRDIKTWDNYAYVSTEGGGGITIIDLSPLPGTITTSTTFTGSAYPFTRSHNVYIDESGKLYIFGSNYGLGGAIICDLTADPMNPVELGVYDENYFHDGMVRGDTLWGAAIYQGKLMAVDVSDPANPVTLGSAQTPGNFTHNIWVSDNGQNVFTTDEESGAYITAFDVSDMNDIYETDRVRSNPGSGVIPHNVHVQNNYLVTSYYTDGVVIHDASRPGNVIEVGNYDTSPQYSGNGFHGCWGAYPFLPSGNILASDIEEGLYVLGPDYKRACYVEGTVTDSITGLPLESVSVTILETDISTTTGADGSYAFGTVEAGTYDIEYALTNYPSDTVKNVSLVNGELTIINVALLSVFTGLTPNSEDIRLVAYPNPFIYEMKIDFELDGLLFSGTEIRVFNMYGQLIEKIAVNTTSGTLTIGNGYPKGLYLIEIDNGRQMLKSLKVSKQ
ncbi:MAG: choice-of-anchor B family protein [Chlorobi bacterium]|nr:choice-of-anchor B family protein [Chlorobiota bacterium]